MGTTLASVVISGATLRASATTRSTWLSTSPFWTAVTTPDGSPSARVESSGCALGSEMRPTLAQRVWPSSDPSTAGAARARASSPSAARAPRSAAVLSPSSPISAATFTTKARPPPSRTRTLPVRCRGSAVRATTAGSAGSRPWSQRVSWRPAESRPRTSRRSIADRACWVDSNTARPASLGAGAALRRDATPTCVPRRSRVTDHRASRTRTRAALASSTSVDSPSTSSKPTSSLGATARVAVTRPTNEGSRSRARSPGTPPNRRSAPSSRSAASDSRDGSAVPRRSTAATSGARTSSEPGTARPEGRRRTAMMPHMCPGLCPFRPAEPIRRPARQL